MLDRTSTYRVLEFILKDKASNFDELVQTFKDEGHKRKDHDVKRMFNQLVRAGLIRKWQIHVLFKDVLELEPDGTGRLQIKVTVRMLNYLQDQKLMVFPFLEAVSSFPNQAGSVAMKARELCRKYGYYHVRVDRDDNAPAMKNFLAFLKLMVPGKGKYELTPLGRAVMETYLHPRISRLQRAQCSEESCRKVCPADVIDPYTISSACIQCGLCVKACPYGGILSQESCYVINPTVCDREKGTSLKTRAGPVDLLMGMEGVLQEWLTSLFQLGGWEAVIPGKSGPYPDVVVFDRSIWIECKVKNVTGKHLIRVVKQIKRYQARESIEKTIEQVRSHCSNQVIETPKLFLLCAPNKSDINGFLSAVSDFIFPTGFISIESLHEVSDYLVRSNNLLWKESFPKERSNLDYSDIVMAGKGKIE
jgi:ferredoxin